MVGVPASTIPELFEAADHVWLRTDAGQWTYGEAHERILAAAGALAQRGAGPREVVLATTRNTPDHLFMWLGLMYLGAIFVPVNPRGTDESTRRRIPSYCSAARLRRWLTPNVASIPATMSATVRSAPSSSDSPVSM